MRIKKKKEKIILIILLFMSESHIFSGHSWFEHHLGFKESSTKVMQNIEVEDLEDRSEIISKINGKRISCGKFSLKGMSSYENLLDSLQNPINGTGHFHIIHGNGANSLRKDLVDSTCHENNEDFNGATFLSASNFNLLEYGSSTATAHIGISQYATDSTQGPAFATATLGATLYRTYFVKHKIIDRPKNNSKSYNSNSNYFIDYTEDNSEYKYAVGQLDYELNLLERTPIPVIHGKAQLNRHFSELTKTGIFQNKELFDYTDENSYEIAVIQNAEVTTNKESWNKYFDSKPGQFVHQIFASSFDLNSYVDSSEVNLDMLKYLLFYEYKMTILQAIENSIVYPNRPGSKKLVLTLLGAGFFRNPIEIVTGAIKKNKELILASGLDVYIVCYNDDIFRVVHPLLAQLVEETGGSIIETN